MGGGAVSGVAVSTIDKPYNIGALKNNDRAAFVPMSKDRAAFVPMSKDRISEAGKKGIPRAKRGRTALREAPLFRRKGLFSDQLLLSPNKA
jgi:hypothetical protein